MLITTQTSFLRAIQQSAGNGYFHYATGTVKPDKLIGFLKKMSGKYEVNLSPQQAWRAGKKGKARTKLFLFAPDENFRWVLMATDGEGIVHQDETLKDLRLKKYRLQVLGYELIRQQKKDGKHGYTWRIEREKESYLQDELTRAIRNKNDLEIRSQIERLNRLSSFAGVRKQRKRLQSVINTDFRRVFGKNIENPYKIKNLFFTRLKIASVKNLNQFLSEMAKNERSASEQLRVYWANRKKRGEPAKPYEPIEPAEPKKKGLFGLPFL